MPRKTKLFDEVSVLRSQQKPVTVKLPVVRYIDFSMSGCLRFLLREVKLNERTGSPTAEKADYLRATALCAFSLEFGIPYGEAEEIFNAMSLADLV